MTIEAICSRERKGTHLRGQRRSEGTSEMNAVKKEEAKVATESVLSRDFQVPLSLQKARGRSQQKGKSCEESGDQR